METRDLNGPTAQTSVVAWGPVTGLHLWHSATITFAQPVSGVEVTLARFATPATATALDGAENVVATAVTTAGQQVEETLVLTGTGIAAVLVESPADEVLLSRVCWTD